MFNFSSTIEFGDFCQTMAVMAVSFLICGILGMSWELIETDKIQVYVTVIIIDSDEFLTEEEQNQVKQLILSISDSPNTSL